MIKLVDDHTVVQLKVLLHSEMKETRLKAIGNLLTHLGIHLTKTQMLDIVRRTK